VSEERARLMTAEVKDYAIFMLDSQGRVASWNEGAKRINGYEPQEVIGSHFSRFYTPEDIARNHPTHELEIANKEGRYEEEGWRVRKNGSRFWASVTITRINDPAGKLLGFGKVTRDLTERKRAEEARVQEQRKIAMLEQAKENEAILDQIFAESPSFMALLSVPDYRFLKSNAQHEKLIRKSNIVGKRLVDVEPELEAQGIIDLLNNVVNTGKPFIAREMPIEYARGEGEGARITYLDFVFQPLKRANGEIYAIAAQGYEVTEKVQARKSIERAMHAVENERENFRNLFKQTPEMVCILKGPDHVFEFVNEAHVRTLGFDATGMALKKAQPESVEVHDILDEVYRTGKTAELREIKVTVTDRLRYFNLTYSAKRDEDGKINGVMVLGVEVTDQVKAREDLKKAVRARDEFLSIASHELKTPLTSLQMQAQLRKRKILKGDIEAFTPEKLIKLFDSDKYHIERLTRLIDDMLDVTRISSSRLAVRPEAVDLKTVLTSAIEKLVPQYSVAGSQVVTPQLDSCPGSFDPFRMEQVFVNLLTNALRYGEGKPVEVSLERQDQKARVKIKDQGIGVASQDQERIFQQFERATETGAGSGLGLGLYISKQIIASHRGTIRVESDLGKGATFVVELPLGDGISTGN
jgi:PAS domain S-box-containing protein